MRNERHETVADNVSAKHHFREVAKMIPHEEVDVSKMETTTSTSEESSAVGNVAAMREALEHILWCLGWMSDNAENEIIKDHLAKPIELAKSALSAPPRNCDVGTPEEQSARFDAHCRKHIRCLTCPLREKDGGVPKHYEFAWSQMQYEEGGAE